MHRKTDFTENGLPESLKNLSRQDAMVLLVVFAARIGVGEKKAQASTKIHRLLELCRRHPLFEETEKSTLDRINLYVNFMAGEIPSKVIKQAAKTLPQGLRQDTYAWATDLLGPDISASEISNSLEELRRMLDIEHAIAEEHKWIIKHKQM
jgi:hypothetical protein